MEERFCIYVASAGKEKEAERHIENEREGTQKY